MRLLLVEDYEPLRKSVAQGLREAGYAVDETADGDEGLWMCKDNHYDVIILDVMLPSVDGWEILKTVRSAEIDSHIIMLTAKGEVDDRVKGLDLGADDYLVKPFAMEELIARVGAGVRRSYLKKSPLISIENVTIDSGKRELQVNNQVIELTAKEYALLEYLVMRKGEVVSRSDIWEHIYEFRSEAQSNVVDVYIGYLRKKLSKHDAAVSIETKRGHGYIIN